MDSLISIPARACWEVPQTQFIDRSWWAFLSGNRETRFIDRAVLFS